MSTNKAVLEMVFKIKTKDVTARVASLDKVDAVPDLRSDLEEVGVLAEALGGDYPAQYNVLKELAETAFLKIGGNA